MVTDGLNLRGKIRLTHLEGWAENAGDYAND